MKDSIYLLSHHSMCTVGSSGQGSMVTWYNIMLKQSRGKNLFWHSSARSKSDNLPCSDERQEGSFAFDGLQETVNWDVLGHVSLHLCFFNHSRFLNFTLYRESSLRLMA